MKESGGTPFLISWFPESPGAGLHPAVSLIIAVALLLAAFAAGRRNAPLSLRRGLFFFLLLSALLLGSSLLSPPSFVSAGPGLLVAAQILTWVGLFEFVQCLLIDLVRVRWLNRPPVPRILRDFASLAVAIAVFLIALRGTLGVNLTSLLATSAMISVVLGLALQDTLGSFFAGLALQMEAPLAIGEWVRFGEHEGRVTQVGWRTVRIETLDGDEITFPNSLVTRATLQNFSRPALAHRDALPVRISYRHPPHEVLASLTEAMRGVPGVLDDPPPHAVVWEFGESEVRYRARYWIEDYSRANLIRSEVATRIWYRLQRDGIDHAFPARVLKGEAPRPSGEEFTRRTAAALLAVDFFAPLTEPERLTLAARLRPQLFARGETVIRQGERGESLFLVTRGRVEVKVASGGEASVVGTLGEGSVFGEMSLLTGDPRTATVVALEDTEVIAVPRAEFRHIAAANPALLEEVARIVSSRRGKLAETIRETEEAAAARAAAHRDLLDRVRAFFGV